ncbi:hypothetical protein [Saccharopolyspora endophytica]|uniref:Schlafen AlbA-2 domain-containing protein n=1 Tax=Saccharopolyspora endophytica TaxID=543886 RepID=A0ABS5DQR6_9PSEU|nr:hypothetical protein [Saccharopolyspora endophytica]MBQ0928649.1 hypothetical protein [Saccharopolyspora endophytica]
MPDDHAPVSPSELMPKIDESSLRRILEHVLALGDEAETSYLEVKSSLDLTKTAGVAKVAKFLLGAANRRPQEAVRNFQGYAVLVIGAQKGQAQGIPRGVEAHELEDRLRQYLGPQFPAFEFGRIGVDEDREVLFLIAQPPQEGQGIFPCHKSFQGEDRRDSLDDGAIYVRGASNTRPARAGEVLGLVERARGGGKFPIELDVGVLGVISRVKRVDDVLERLYDFEEEQFTKPRGRASRSVTPPFLVQSVFGRSMPVSPEEREARLDAWRAEKSAHIAQGRQHFLGVVLPGAGIKIVSRGRFVAKPQLIVTFHECEAIDYLDADDADYMKVVEPVVGRQEPFGVGFDPGGFGFTPRGYPVSWRNRGNDAEVVLTPESLRPDTPWMSDQDDYVILARDLEASFVTVTWGLTEDGNDAVTTGEFQAPTGDAVDAADLIKAVFLEDQ